MGKFSLLLPILFFLTEVKAQDTDKSVSFTGGMFVQPSIYLSDVPGHDGFSFGLGGMLKFQMTDHFFLGGAGGTMHRNYETYGSENSYLDLGYGGLIGGWYNDFDKWRLSAQLFAGMGKKTHLQIGMQSGNTLTDAEFYEQPVLLISPSLGTELYLSEKISFLVQAEFMAAFVETAHDFFMPVLRFGILFNR